MASTLSLKNTLSIAIGYSDVFTDDWIISCADFFKYMKDERHKPSVPAPASRRIIDDASMADSNASLSASSSGEGSSSQPIDGAARIQQHVDYANNVVQTLQQRLDSPDITPEDKRAIKKLLTKSKQAEKTFRQMLDSTQDIPTTSSTSVREKFGGLYLIMAFQPLIVIDKVSFYPPLLILLLLLIFLNKVKRCLKLVEDDIKSNGTEEEKQAMSVMQDALFKGERSQIWTDHMLGIPI